MGARRILIVSNLFPPHVVGGAEVVAWRQARLLAAHGHHVEVFAGWVPTEGDRYSLTVEESDGLRVWRTPVASFHYPDNFHSSHLIRRFEAVLEAAEPDLVHFHNVAGLGYSLVPAARRSGRKVIVTLHDHAGYCYRATALRPGEELCGDPEECAAACDASIRPQELGIELPMRLRRDYVLWALEHADRLVSPSASLAAAIQFPSGVNGVRVISNGIDLGPFTSPSRPDPEIVRFLCVAYLGEHKGIPVLLDALERLARRPELSGRWSMLLAGEGHLRKMVEADLANGRFGGAVTYEGRLPRERIIHEMARSHAVVLPSQWPENEPVVMLEAIGAGVAQIGTDIGGTPALIDRGVTGILVPPGDAAALAEAMESYIREPAAAVRHGQNNWARRHRFSEEATVGSLLALYDEPVRSSASPARPLVICAGEPPGPHIFDMCRELYRLEEPCPGARLVWHRWLNPSDWERAALLWHWSPSDDAGVIRQALRAGVPLLAPASSSLARQLRTSFAAAAVYDTYLDGLVTLARLPHDGAALEGMRRRCPEAAAVLTAAAPASQYPLRLDPLTA